MWTLPNLKQKNKNIYLFLTKMMQKSKKYYFAIEIMSKKCYYI